MFQVKYDPNVFGELNTIAILQPLISEQTNPATFFNFARKIDQRTVEIVNSNPNKC